MVSERPTSSSLFCHVRPDRDTTLDAFLWKHAQMGVEKGGRFKHAGEVTYSTWSGKMSWDPPGGAGGNVWRPGHGWVGGWMDGQTDG